MGGYFAAKVSEGSFGPHDVFRKELGPDGQPIYHTVENDQYINPPSNVYHLKVTGFTRPFERERKPEYLKPGQDPMQTVTHLELEIMDGPGQGVRFLWAYQNMAIGFSKQNPSNLGRIIMAGKYDGAEPPKGVQFFFDDIIECEFMAYVDASDELIQEGPNQGKPKYSKPNRESIKPVRAGSAEASTANPFARVA